MAQHQTINKFVLGNKEMEGKTAEFLYDRGTYFITDIVGEERTQVYKSRNMQEAYLKWNVYIGRKKERPERRSDSDTEENRGTQGRGRSKRSNPRRSSGDGKVSGPDKGGRAKKDKDYRDSAGRRDKKNTNREQSPDNRRDGKQKFRDRKGKSARKPEKRRRENNWKQRMDEI